MKVGRKDDAKQKHSNAWMEIFRYKDVISNRCFKTCTLLDNSLSVL